MQPVFAPAILPRSPRPAAGGLATDAATNPPGMQPGSPCGARSGRSSEKLLMPLRHDTSFIRVEGAVNPTAP
jgi:hypothetical protein